MHADATLDRRAIRGASPRREEADHRGRRKTSSTDHSLRRSFRASSLFLAPHRCAPQEARVALNILTGSKLVIKRIASKETKNPRVPVDGDALVAEVRF